MQLYYLFNPLNPVFIKYYLASSQIISIENLVENSMQHHSLTIKEYNKCLVGLIKYKLNLHLCWPVEIDFRLLVYDNKIQHYLL